MSPAVSLCGGQSGTRVATKPSVTLLPTEVSLSRALERVLFVVCSSAGSTAVAGNNTDSTEIGHEK